MARVLAIDAGFTMGFGFLASGRKTALAGSHALRGSSVQMGVGLKHMREVVLAKIAEFRPTVIVAAMPWVSRFATPIEMLPIFAFHGRLQEVADELGIPFRAESESSARRAFLQGGVPRKSKDIKKAVMAECRSRGWPVCDNHAADALCMADFVLGLEKPSAAHERMPLFTSAPPVKRRRRTKEVANG